MIDAIPAGQDRTSPQEGGTKLLPGTAASRAADLAAAAHEAVAQGLAAPGPELVDRARLEEPKRLRAQHERLVGQANSESTETAYGLSARGAGAPAAAASPTCIGRHHHRKARLSPCTF